MKKLILIALAFAAGCVLMYLVSAFVAWDMDAGNWAPIARYLVAVASLAVGGFLATLAFTLLDRT